MKQILYYSVISLFAFGCKNETSVHAIVEDFENQRAKANSYEYDIHYKMKYFSSDQDTLNYFSNCRLIRHESDTIFGGSFWIKNDSIDRYYDLENIYIIDHKEKKITRYFPKLGQDWAVKGNTVSGVLNSYFFELNKLSKHVKDSTNTIALSDTIYKNDARNAITVQFADELPIEQPKKTFLFDQKNSLKSIIYSVKFQNETQYNEWHFANEKYDALTDQQLKSEFEALTKNYSIEDYKAPNPKEMEPLAVGLKAPMFTGFSFQAKDSVNLDGFKNKYVLIDFWYKDCFPCIKAIASLNKIRAKYAQDKLAILGLNPFDAEEEKHEKLLEFMKTNKMSYPTIFVDANVTKDYNVRAYPTFYILDKNGNIVYSTVGHSEENEKEIDSLLHEWIK